MFMGIHEYADGDWTVNTLAAESAGSLTFVLFHYSP